MLINVIKKISHNPIYFSLSLTHRVVGGLKTLDAMEAVEVDKKDKPKVGLLFYVLRVIFLVIHISLNGNCNQQQS